MADVAAVLNAGWTTWSGMYARPQQHHWQPSSSRYHTCNFCATISVAEGCRCPFWGDLAAEEAGGASRAAFKVFRAAELGATSSMVAVLVCRGEGHMSACTPVHERDKGANTRLSWGALACIPTVLQQATSSLWTRGVWPAEQEGLRAPTVAGSAGAACRGLHKRYCRLYAAALQKGAVLQAVRSSLTNGGSTAGCMRRMVKLLASRACMQAVCIEHEQ